MLFRARRARLSEASRPALDVSGDHHMEPQWRKAYSHNHFPHGFRSLQWSTMESEGCREKRITVVTPSLLCCNDYPLRTLRVDTPKWICQAVLMGKPTGAGMRYCLGALGFYMPFYSDSRKPPLTWPTLWVVPQHRSQSHLTCFPLVQPPKHPAHRHCRPRCPDLISCLISVVL